MQTVSAKTTWGQWRFNANLLVLELTLNPGYYEIDLEKITNSAQMLDWIFHIHRKTWCTNDITGDLVSAFEHVFGPQVNLYGWGNGEKIDATAFLKKRFPVD